MSAYTLTLLRHGEIDHAGRLIGRTDLALTAQGWQQLHASWASLSRSAPVTALASSPLQRCHGFALESASACALPLYVAPGFAELDFGDWDGQPSARLEAQLPGWGLRLAAGELCPPGGEDYAGFRLRILAALAQWNTQATGNHRVLITHGGVITLLLAELLGLPFSAARLISVPRGGFAQLSLLAGHPAYLTRLESPCVA
ncbi:histidine phosphatase family protein [Craterilacuibacter sp. RT1T]|uniref:histidine phosphatase family protein n=1 Tax=Craterilacuibacter sp. RT1T TaxID=2942211 RepID=UPI0020C031EB|nr:histidine phosphatase family protein [Craterilacuibacter sp. RT1T]MCL6264204.1 histidine phosphatase family protein [Craterilacuibacter sp. RT1T]